MNVMGEDCEQMRVALAELEVAVRSANEEQSQLESELGDAMVIVDAVESRNEQLRRRIQKLMNQNQTLYGKQREVRKLVEETMRDSFKSEHQRWTMDHTRRCGTHLGGKGCWDVR